MAAALFRHHLASRGIDETVSSAGLLTEGRPATDDAIEVLTARRVEVADHRSRQLTAAIVDGADLVVGMTREHTREVFGIDDGALGRSVTLREVVRRAGQTGIREPGEALTDWARRLTADRDPEELLGTSADDDIDDPIGRPRRVYEDLADELDRLTARLVECGWPAPFYGSISSER